MLTWPLVALSLCAAAAPPPTLAELAREYRALGLPLPPANARLVKRPINEHDGDTRFMLALQVAPGVAADGPTLLTGVWQDTVSEDAIEIVPATPAAVRGHEWETDVGLLLAVQCHMLGWKDLADHLADGAPRPRESLARSAWALTLAEMDAGRGDRRPAAEKLRHLLRTYAAIDTPHNRALLRSLDAALVPGTTKPESAEALIDALVEEAGGGFKRMDMQSEAYWKLAEMGFDAVPALIAHLDDHRLTRAMRDAGRSRWFHLRVRDLASDLLENLAGEPLDRGGDDVIVTGVYREHGWPVRKSAAVAWWDTVRPLGEEAYLVARLQPPAGDPDRRNSHVLRLLAAKYPNRLAALYRAVLDAPAEYQSRDLAETVGRSRLPDREKTELLAAAGRHTGHFHRYAALDVLAGVDRPRFHEVLRKWIDETPTDTTEAKYRGCIECLHASLATRTGDPAVWTALARAAARAKVGLRMELLGEIADTGTSFFEPRPIPAREMFDGTLPPPQFSSVCGLMLVPTDPARLPRRAARLRLLRAFLDDRTVRVRAGDERFDDLCAGHAYPKIEVRDYAAVKLAELLAIDIAEEPDRTPAEWATVRATVRAALDRELDRTRK